MRWSIGYVVVSMAVVACSALPRSPTPPPPDLDEPGVGSAVIRATPGTLPAGTTIELVDEGGTVPGGTFAAATPSTKEFHVAEGDYAVRLGGRLCRGSFGVATGRETSVTVSRAQDGSCSIAGVAQATEVPPSVISGRLIGARPADYSVELWAHGVDSPLTTAVPDDEGRYALSVPPGIGEIRVVRAGTVVVRRDVLVATGRSLDLDLVVPAE